MEASTPFYGNHLLFPWSESIIPVQRQRGKWWTFGPPKYILNYQLSVSLSVAPDTAHIQLDVSELRRPYVSLCGPHVIVAPANSKMTL